MIETAEPRIDLTPKITGLGVMTETNIPSSEMGKKIGADHKVQEIDHRLTQHSRITETTHTIGIIEPIATNVSHITVHVTPDLIGTDRKALNEMDRVIGIKETETIITNKDHGMGIDHGIDTTTIGMTTGPMIELKDHKTDTFKDRMTTTREINHIDETNHHQGTRISIDNITSNQGISTTPTGT
jgi:hypothetical protein